MAPPCRLINQETADGAIIIIKVFWHIMAKMSQRKMSDTINEEVMKDSSGALMLKNLYLTAPDAYKTYKRIGALVLGIARILE